MIDFDNLMKKIDYLARINPAIIHPPLSPLGKAALKPSHKPMSKEQARKLSPDGIEKLYDEEISRQREQRDQLPIDG